MSNDNLTKENINQIFMEHSLLKPKLKKIKHKSYTKDIEKLEEKAK